MLNTATGNSVDIVNIGCPHCTIVEIREIASLLEGKKIHKDVRFYVGTGPTVYTIAKLAGYADIIEKAGGILAPHCVNLENPLYYIGYSSFGFRSSTFGAPCRLKLTPLRKQLFPGGYRHFSQG